MGSRDHDWPFLNGGFRASQERGRWFAYGKQNPGDRSTPWKLTALLFPYAAQRPPPAGCACGGGMGDWRIRGEGRTTMVAVPCEPSQPDGLSEGIWIGERCRCLQQSLRMDLLVHARAVQPARSRSIGRCRQSSDWSCRCIWGWTWRNSDTSTRWANLHEHHDVGI